MLIQNETAGHRRGHRRHARPGLGRAWRRGRLCDRGARAVRVAADGLGRARPARLVARDRPRRARVVGAPRSRRRRNRVRRILRSDARRCPARWQRRGLEARAHLVRPAHGRAVPLDHGARRRGPPHRAYVEPRAHKLHAHEDALGARARAGALGASPHGSSAEGLRALSSDGRARHGRCRRFRHAPVRRGRSPLV